MAVHLGWQSLGPALLALASSTAPSPQQRVPIGGPRSRPSPLEISLAAEPGDLEVHLAFQATDSSNAPIAFLELAKGTTKSVVESLTEADFANPPAGVEILALLPNDSSYVDKAVSEEVEYFYRLHGCDAGSAPSCALSTVATGRASSIVLAFAFGAEEPVFGAPEQACPTTTGFDVSDVPAHALRRSDGSLLLTCGNSRGNFFDEGPDFGSLQRNCSMPAPLDSNFDDDPSHFDYQRWVSGTYRDPDSAHPDRIHVLLHKEFHDTIHPPCPNPGVACQFSYIGYAYSDDGGHSYFEPPLPDRLVAALPYPWDPNLSDPDELGPFPYGYFIGSSIFKKDGFYYAFVFVICNPVHPAGNTYMSLMRTSTLEDPLSWRFWDGTGFNHQTRNPYVNGVSFETAIANPEVYFAGRLDPNLIGLTGSLTYNTYLDKYMMIGHYGWAEDNIPCGFYYALSNDLIHWSIKRKFLSVNMFECDPEAPADYYPAVIDHDSPSLNFETADDTFEMYYLHYRTNTDRDLVRVPVTITRT
jgi:hypothetical protein